MIAFNRILQAVSRLRSSAACAVFVFWLVASSFAAALPGAPDASFSSGFGTVLTPIGSGTDVAYRVALQPDGMIVVAGTCANGVDFDFCLARYLANGTLDTSFNGTGKVITAIGSGNDGAYTLALQPDGKIVVAGSCLNGTTYDFCLARYFASGALDSSFNGAGKVFTPIGNGTDAAYSVALQPDGNIVVAGRCFNGTGIDFCLARYLTNGALDASFGSNGKVLTPIGRVYDVAFGLALQPDGKIVVAGYCFNGANDDFCLARYLANGTLDTSFNGSGTVIAPIGNGNDNAINLALQPDGKIVVVGVCANGANLDFCLARYLANGTPDTSFNSSGKVIAPIGSSDDYGYSVALQPDGKIVVAGYCSNGANLDFCLARYLANGTLDASFNSTGKVIAAIGGGNDVANSVALQPDGKIVVAGYCYNGANDDFCLARFEGGPFAASPSLQVVEYYSINTDSYFLTGRTSEKNLLDGYPALFGRTGMEITAVAASGTTPGPLAICRYFYKDAGINSTHFYGSGGDCPLLNSTALTNTNFHDEGFDFVVGSVVGNALPPTICPASAPYPVYRSFRAGTATKTSNHRYTVSAASYNAINSAGYVGEGAQYCATYALDHS